MTIPRDVLAALEACPPEHAVTIRRHLDMASQDASVIETMKDSHDALQLATLALQANRAFHPEMSAALAELRSYRAASTWIRQKIDGLKLYHWAAFVVGVSVITGSITHADAWAWMLRIAGAGE